MQLVVLETNLAVDALVDYYLRCLTVGVHLNVLAVTGLDKLWGDSEHTQISMLTLNVTF
jgi:hypothetical protein